MANIYCSKHFCSLVQKNIYSDFTVLLPSTRVNMLKLHTTVTCCSKLLPGSYLAATWQLPGSYLAAPLLLFWFGLSCAVLSCENPSFPLELSLHSYGILWKVIEWEGSLSGNLVAWKLCKRGERGSTESSIEWITIVALIASKKCRTVSDWLLAENLCACSCT